MAIVKSPRLSMRKHSAPIGLCDSSLRRILQAAARSRDLSGCYYFWWGYLKGRVFICKPRTIAEIEQSIKEEIAAIPEQMTRQVMENLVWEMVGDIGITYFLKLKMAFTKFSSDYNFCIKRWKFIVLFNFENRQGFLPHPVYKVFI
jgi:hypothetical protein